MAEKTTKKEKEEEKVNDLVSNYREYSSKDISIKPYFDPTVANMGLEKYGQVFFEGTGMMQSLRSIEINGVERYITGLDEFAPSVKSIKDDKEREAKIKSIRDTVSRLEYEIFFNKVDPKDASFWEKVNLKPTNAEFWGKVFIVVGNQPLYLDPNDPTDLLKIIAAESGGFDEVAGSLDEVKNELNKSTKFYLDKERDIKIEEGRLKMTRDKALYELYKMRMEAPQGLFWIAKNLLPIANSYRQTDSPDIFYGQLSDYIEGLSIEKNKKIAPLRFLEWVEKPEEYKRIRAYVLESIFLKHLITKADNKIYDRESGSMLGGNIQEVIEYLRQATNQRDLDLIESRIDKVWNK